MFYLHIFESFHIKLGNKCFTWFYLLFLSLWPSYFSERSKVILSPLSLSFFFFFSVPLCGLQELRNFVPQFWPPAWECQVLTTGPSGVSKSSLSHWLPFLWGDISNLKKFRPSSVTRMPERSLTLLVHEVWGSAVFIKSAPCPPLWVCVQPPFRNSPDFWKHSWRTVNW